MSALVKMHGATSGAAKSSCVCGGMKGGLTNTGRGVAQQAHKAAQGLGRNQKQKGKESSCSGPTVLGPGGLFHIRQSIQSCTNSTFHIGGKYAGLDPPVYSSSWKGLSFIYGILQLLVAYPDLLVLFFDLLVLTSIHNVKSGHQCPDFSYHC